MRLKLFEFSSSSQINSLAKPVAPVVQLVTSKPSDIGTRVRILVSSHELRFFLIKKIIKIKTKNKMPNKWRTTKSLVAGRPGSSEVTS